MTPSVPNPFFLFFQHPTGIDGGGGDPGTQRLQHLHETVVVVVGQQRKDKHNPTGGEKKSQRVPSHPPNMFNRTQIDAKRGWRLTEFSSCWGL